MPLRFRHLLVGALAVGLSCRCLLAEAPGADRGAGADPDAHGRHA